MSRWVPVWPSKSWPPTQPCAQLSWTPGSPWWPDQAVSPVPTLHPQPPAGPEKGPEGLWQTTGPGRMSSGTSSLLPPPWVGQCVLPAPTVGGKRVRLYRPSPSRSFPPPRLSEQEGGRCLPSPSLWLLFWHL